MLRLLDSPQIITRGVSVGMTMTKPALLLCYLAMQGTWVSRSSLALLFRPDAPEDAARHTLRLILSRAKNLPWAGGLEIETGRVRFVVSTDVEQFRLAIGRSDWQSAIDLYKKPFLYEVVTDSPTLEEWLHLERERLSGAWREAMLAQALEAEQSQAASLLWRLWQDNELDEMVLQHYLKAAYLSGQREAALVAFKRFVSLLEELGSTPNPQTLELQRLILTAQPLRAFPNPAAIPLEVLRPPQLIGRVSQAKQLLQSQSPMVAILGEAGIGKSRFVQDNLPDARLLCCPEGLEGISYASLLVYIKQHLEPDNLNALGVYREDLARFLPELGVGQVNPDPISAKNRLLEALARFFEQQPSPLLFDDLQWADHATLEFIGFFLARGTHRVFATVRQVEISSTLEQYLRAWRAERIVLAPLTLQEVEDLISSLVGQSKRYPMFSQVLFERSGGNVFFLLEIIKALFERGALRVEQHDWHSVLDHISTDYHELSVPTRVSELILTRVGRLPEHTQLILQAASVLAGNLHLEQWFQVTSLPHSEVLTALENLEQANIVQNGHFVHDLLRQSVYDSLSQPRREYWHSQATKLDLPRPERIKHFLAAKRNKEAFVLLLEEGAHNKKMGFIHQAHAAYQKAHDLEPERMDVLADLALLENQLSLPCLDHAQLVLKKTQEARPRAVALNVLASLAYSQGDLTTAAQDIEEALQLAQTFSRDDADLEETAFDIFEAQRRYEECIGMLEQARIRLSAYPESGDLAVIISSLAAIYDDTERTEQALPLHFEALDIAKRCQARYAQVSASVQIMWALRHANRSAEAVDIAREALSYGEFGNSEYLRNGLGASLMFLGRNQEALAPYEHNAKHGNITTQALAWGRLATLYDLLGRSADCQHATAMSLECALQTQVSFAQLRACIAILNYGTDQQLEQILPLVRGQRSPDTAAQAELEVALKARGIQFYEKTPSS